MVCGSNFLAERPCCVTVGAGTMVKKLASHSPHKRSFRKNTSLEDMEKRARNLGKVGQRSVWRNVSGEA
ncbi:unnamed protein product [Toxocara canis]|uniref:Secreted protein n=1 Tax=Toxocara canis TaxID=6265 RepID=A0A183V7Y9_TOXCA|nr:unnamed protein product [Toxocara canis]